MDIIEGTDIISDELTEANPVNQFNILSLDKVKIGRRHKVTRASIAQLVKRLSTSKITNPKNKYQESLNIFFESENSKLADRYNEILQCSSYDEMVVKEYNLLGDLPGKMEITEPCIQKSNTLSKASIGDMINALRQRIQFIINREIPLYYVINESYKTEFNNMQQQITEFENAVDEYEENWIEANDIAQKTKIS